MSGAHKPLPATTGTRPFSKLSPVPFARSVTFAAKAAPEAAAMYTLKESPESNRRPRTRSQIVGGSIRAIREIRGSKTRPAIQPRERRDQSLPRQPSRRPGVTAPRS